MRSTLPFLQRGATLLELLFSLGIVVAGLCAALPWFGDIAAAAPLRSSMQQWMSTLATARSSAVSSGGSVVACPAVADRCLETLWWHHGWIVFLDGNHNAQHDEAEPILLRGGALDGVQVASSSGRQRIRYQADGSSGGSNVSLTFCDRRGLASARTIVINNAGRARSGTATPQQALQACAGLGKG